MNNDCPCAAVLKLEAAVERHEERLQQGSTDFAVIRTDLNYIKGKLDERAKFNTQTLACIVQAVCTLMVALIAAKLGLG